MYNQTSNEHCWKQPIFTLHIYISISITTISLCNCMAIPNFMFQYQSEQKTSPITQNHFKFFCLFANCSAETFKLRFYSPYTNTVDTTRSRIMPLYVHPSQSKQRPLQMISWLSNHKYTWSSHVTNIASNIVTFFFLISA